MAPDGEERLREDFAAMTRAVHLVFFTQALDCNTCLETRQILDELPRLSDRIVIDEVNFILERDRASAYGIDRVPAVAVAFEDPGQQGAIVDARMRFLGVPSGYDFISLVNAVLLAGGRPSSLPDASQRQLAAVQQPITLQVFTTPTCPHCPRAVLVAYEMAQASPHVTAYGVEVSEFPDLVRRYRVNGVPKTVVNDQIEILGALPAGEFIDQALGKSPAAH